MENNSVKVKEYGLDVIYRHDYDKSQEGNNISKYIEKSCTYLKKFLTNVRGNENFKTFWDLGCGNAQALDYFKGQFENCTGIDLYPQEHDERIVEKTFYDLQHIANTLHQTPDVVFINHTLEHSLAPLLMEQITKVHNVGGVIFIAVPDADYPWSYEITSSTTHWSIFNEGFLRTLLQRYGYECVVEKKCFRENCGELFAVGIKRW